MLWAAGWSSVPLSRSECGVSLRNASHRVKRSYPECKFVVWTALGRKYLIPWRFFSSTSGQWRPSIQSRLFRWDNSPVIDTIGELVCLLRTIIDHWGVDRNRFVTFHQTYTNTGVWYDTSESGTHPERQLNQCFLVLDQHIHFYLDVGYDPVFRFFDSSGQDRLYLSFVNSQQANLYQ